MIYKKISRFKQNHLHIDDLIEISCLKFSNKIRHHTLLVCVQNELVNQKRSFKATPICNILRILKTKIEARGRNNFTNIIFQFLVEIMRQANKNINFILKSSVISKESSWKK
jgi:hypothetical protein